MANIRQAGDISADRAPDGSGTGRSRPKPPLSMNRRAALFFLALFVPLSGIMVGGWLRVRILRAGAERAGATDLKFANALLIVGVIFTIWAVFLTILALNPVGSLPPDSPMLGG